MISYRFKRILAVWLFVPLSFINAAAGMSPVIGAQAAPRMELSVAGDMLYKYAFPEKLSYVDEKGTVAATTLGQAVLCFAKAPMRGTPVEAGVISNIGLLDLIATKMTEKMVLNVGRAAYAYESIALKTVNEIHRKQASLQALNPEQIKAVQKTLAAMAKYEAGFLGVVSQENFFAEANLDFAQDLVSPIVFGIIPSILQYKMMDNLNIGLGVINDAFAAEQAKGLKYFFKQVIDVGNSKGTHISLDTLRSLEVAIDRFSEAEQEVQKAKIAEALAHNPQALAEMEKMKKDIKEGRDPNAMPLIAKIAIPMIAPHLQPIVLGTVQNPTQASQQLTSLGNTFQNKLKVSPELYTAFSHTRELVALSSIIAGYLGTSAFAGMLISPYEKTIKEKLGSYVDSKEVVKHGPKVIAGAFTAFRLYNQARGLISRYSKLKVGRDTLVPLAHFIRGTRELYLSLKDNEALYQTLPEHIVQSFESFFGTSASAERAEMVSLALSATFDNTDSYLFVVGRYARFAQLVATNNTAFKELGCTAGYVDYLTTLAQYIAPESPAVNERGQTIAFSYANFVEDEKPYLMANDLWYPAYDSHKVVATSVKLGDGDPAQHMLITGVNGCGKSIVMSAMMAAVVMAHTHGIVAARENALTPFDYVIFHGNIADEKGAGLSKGVKEMFACSNIIKQVRDAANGEAADLARDVSDVTEVIERTRGLKGRIYLTFDELFSSTDPVSAERLSSVVIRSLIKNPNLMMVATTHNRGLTQLADKTKGLIKNAYIETDFNEKTGEIKYQRQLVSGVNHSMPALFIMKDKLRDAGNVDQSVIDIIDQAIEEQRREGGFVAKA